jgi:hypothetical protein
MARTMAPRDLPPEELQRLLDVLHGADTVELKLTVPDEAQRSAIQGLGLDPLDAQIRQVFFFETPDLALDKAGLVVRARRTQRKGDDSVVKLRPVVPDELPSALRESPNFGVEVDASPTAMVCSGSMKGVPKADVRTVVQGGGRIRDLFTKEQRALFKAHAPDGLELDDLKILGPLFVLKLKATPEGAPARLVVELWLYPDGSRILELSTKCAPSQAFQMAAEARAYLGTRGVDLEGEQQTKTRTALDFFAHELAAEQPAAAGTGRTAAKKSG